jgi:hypothetical protein
VKLRDRLAAAEVVVEEVVEVAASQDEEDDQDDTRKRSGNWRNSRYKMRRSVVSWLLCSPPKAQAHLEIRLPQCLLPMQETLLEEEIPCDALDPPTDIFGGLVTD